MKYVYSFDEESFRSDEFDTREEALESAKDENPDVATIWTGVPEPLNISSLVDADLVLEHAGENAAEEVGDLADDWPNIKPEKVKELNAIIASFIEENDKPTFYAVKDVQRHDIIPGQSRGK